MNTTVAESTTDTPQKLIVQASSSFPYTLSLLGSSLIAIMSAVSLFVPGIAKTDTSGINPALVGALSFALAVTMVFAIFKNNKSYSNAVSQSGIRVSTYLEENYGLKPNLSDAIVSLSLMGSHLQITNKQIPAINSDGRNVLVMLKMNKETTEITPFLDSVEIPKLTTD